MSEKESLRQVKRVRMSSEERRDMILRSAKRVFASSNYAEASTGELARESEITEPMLYKHFGSKKGLFLAVLKKYGTEFFELYQARIQNRAERDILDACTHIICDYRELIKADPETQRILFHAVMEASDPEIAQCVRVHNIRVHGLIRQVFAQAQAEGLLDAGTDLNAASWGFMSVILANQHALMLNLTDDFAPIQREVGQIFLRGLHIPNV